MGIGAGCDSTGEKDLKSHAIAVYRANHSQRTSNSCEEDIKHD